MKISTIVSLVLTGIGTTVIATSAPASATSFSFSNISGGDTVGDDYAGNFSFDVTDSGNNTVLFKFLNQASGSQTSQALKQVAFSFDPTKNALLSNMILNVGNTGTVEFQANTQNLSQSNKISGWESTTFGADTKGGNGNAVQGTESLGIKFNASFNDVIAALNARTLMVGIHVGSLPNGASDSYVHTTPTPQPPKSVPEPGLLAGLLIITPSAAAWLKAKKQKPAA
ncbi:hypothetical protein NIES4071_55290 [Calothrix sp. NIES-4071]|nr:hypothetical protein NIES4071_55290 [Calothrix sp. NIES-4071]BAZ59836.1 hypothetical protein NIES4105_55240 [Calothrix sp. NIES-4105]